MSISKYSFCLSVAFACLVSLIFAPPATAQPGHAQVEIPLEKDARKNGYRTSRENGDIYLVADGVVHPTKKTLLEKLHDLSYRCVANESRRQQRLSFARGRSQRVKVACVILIEPRIIILDEPD